MSWKEKRLPASFRGVPFEVVRDSQPAGQRTQVHEYPQRDKPYVEALGKRTNEIKITAFVAGNGCIEQRDRLLEAIEQTGSGELVHPWLGSLIVSCTDCNYSHDRSAQGVVRFELTFVEGKSEPSYPVAGVDAANALNSSADDIQASALERFTDSLDSIDLSQINAEAVLNPVRQVLTVVEDVYGGALGVLGSAQGVIELAMASPANFAQSVFGVITEVSSTFSGFYSRARGATSLFGLSNRTEGMQRLQGTLMPSGNANRVFASAIRSLVQDAVAADVVRGVATLPVKPVAVERAGAVALNAMPQQSVSVDSGSLGQVVDGLVGVDRVQPPVANDVLSVRDGVSESLWSLAEQSPASHYEVLAQARVAATRHLVAVAKQGSALTRYDNPAPAPALVLAYRRFGDAARVGDIVARNAVSHPGFVPARTLMVPRG